MLLLDKPEGWTSTRALGRAKRLLGIRKGGHTGTLDPFATGLLPLAFGEATKFSRFLTDAPKSYLATLCLGRTSTSGDPEGTLSAPVAFSRSRSEIDAVLGTFEGEQAQVPPMHSALHHEGQRLYELARKGLEVNRPPRTIHIYRLDRVEISGEMLSISVKCSKGTYIRTLAQDIGERLGCGAYLTALRRTQVAGFDLRSAVTLETLEADGPEALQRLLPPESLVGALPRTLLDAGQARAIRHGRAASVTGAPEGETGLFGPDLGFLGVGLADAFGTIIPVRLMAGGEEPDSPDFP